MGIESEEGRKITRNVAVEDEVKGAHRKRSITHSCPFAKAIMSLYCILTKL